jgi:acetyl esterase/lipase
MKFNHPAFYSTPDMNVSSASRVPTAPELQKTDKLVGWVEFNRFTYRALRVINSLFAPKIKNKDQVVIKEVETSINLKIVKPKNIKSEGALIFFYGGGFIAGENIEVLGLAETYAVNCGVTVILPNYRLAPENPFPAALNDASAAWKWVTENAKSIGINSSKIVIGGMSAGGGLAANLAQKILDEGGVQPVAQLLTYPMLDDRTATKRELDKPRHRVWSNSSNQFAWTSLLSNALGESPPKYAVAARREDLSRLPSTWIGVGTSDLFLDEDREYAKRLGESGVDVSYVEIAGAIHGFDAVDCSLTDEFRRLQFDFIIKFTE